MTERAQAVPTEQWFVHYTVNPPHVATKQRFSAGPYTVNEVFDQRRDIATYSGVTDVCISESGNPETTNGGKGN